MSGNAEDEAKARLEVAQLYEGMPGQAAKAARYYMNAAEIYRNAGIMGRARELFQKVVQLDPSNAQAAAILQQMVAGGSAAPAPVVQPRQAQPPQQPPTAGSPAVPGPPPPPAAPAAAGAPRVIIPTPWVSREPRYIAAARGQLTTPPDRSEFPWDPLPPVDPAKVAARAEARKQVAKEAAEKTRTSVPSVFDQSGGSKFGPAKPGGGPAPTSPTFGTPSTPTRPAASAPAAARQTPPPPQGDIRGGNRDLADAIRRKLQGGGR